MKKERALQLMIEVFDGLDKDEFLNESIIMDSDTLLLGRTSPLDSIGLVAFITELEERLIQETDNNDIYLAIDNIENYDSDNPAISAGMMAQYIVKLVGDGDL